MENREFPLENFLNTVQASNIDSTHKTHLLRIPIEDKPLALINREIFNYNERTTAQIKHEKSMQKFQNSSYTDEELLEHFEQFQDYVYSLVSLKNYKSKTSKSKKKVRLYDINTLFGNDDEQMKQDVFQEGRMYLWEGLKKYGVLPKKAKNFNGRMDKGHKRKTSGKSTFVFQNIRNNYINLGKKSNSKKFNGDEHKRIDVEFKPEIYGESTED